MKIIYRYLIKEFLKPLFFTTGLFGGLVLISEFFRELSFYMENKTGFGVVFHYLLLNFPWWTIQVLPVSVLLAVLFSLGQLTRFGEITAIKAAGINLWRIIAMFMVCGLCIGAADFALREFVVPPAVKQAEQLKSERIHREKKPEAAEHHNLVVALPGNARMTMGYLNTRTGAARNIVIDYYDDHFHLTDQIVAVNAQWNPDGWSLVNGVHRTFSNGDWREDYFGNRRLSLALRPDQLVVKRLRPEQMTCRQFRDYIRNFETLGIPADKEHIQYYLRFSSAFSHVIVMLIGIPFALGLAGRHGKILSFTFALIFSFVYWGVQAVGQSLGENRFISPLLAAWIGNIIFGFAGVYLVSKIQK